MIIILISIEEALKLVKEQASKAVKEPPKNTGLEDTDGTDDTEDMDIN